MAKENGFISFWSEPSLTDPHLTAEYSFYLWMMVSISDDDDDDDHHDYDHDDHADGWMINYELVVVIYL